MIKITKMISKNQRSLLSGRMINRYLMYLILIQNLLHLLCQTVKLGAMKFYLSTMIMKKPIKMHTEMIILKIYGKMTGILTVEMNAMTKTVILLEIQKEKQMTVTKDIVLPNLINVLINVLRIIVIVMETKTNATKYKENNR